MLTGRKPLSLNCRLSFLINFIRHHKHKAFVCQITIHNQQILENISQLGLGKNGYIACFYDMKPR
jgi:hypothetical protein